MTPKLETYAIAGVSALLAWTGGYALGHHDGTKSERAKQAVVVSEAATRNAIATGAANVERVQDTATTNTHERDLKDADNAVADSKPSAARLALNCQRLRAQRGGSKLPAECGSSR